MQKCDFLARGFNLGNLLRQTISMERRSFLSPENSQISRCFPSVIVEPQLPVVFLSLGLDRD